MDPGGLFCNIKECRKPISGRAWATVCSHVVCHSCGSKTLDKIPTSCPVCDTLLKKQFEVLNLDPSDELKSVSCGYIWVFFLSITGLFLSLSLPPLSLSPALCWGTVAHPNLAFPFSLTVRFFCKSFLWTVLLDWNVVVDYN